MELTVFLSSIEELHVADIRAIAADLHGAHSCAADEIEITRAVLHLERVVKATRCRADAARAALAVAEAVQAAARRERVRLPDDDVTYVARAAALVARALAAGDLAAADARCLARGFRRIPAAVELTSV